jgi:hypothetical protein
VTGLRGWRGRLTSGAGLRDCGGLRMTFLPIVERELRVAARRRSTYGARLALALVAVLIGVSIYVAMPGEAGQRVGSYVFRALSGLLLVYCLV